MVALAGIASNDPVCTDSGTPHWNDTDIERIAWNLCFMAE
jgi:hypothetical protein